MGAHLMLMHVGLAVVVGSFFGPGASVPLAFGEVSAFLAGYRVCGAVVFDVIDLAYCDVWWGSYVYVVAAFVAVERVSLG